MPRPYYKAADLPFDAVARLLGFLSNAKSREKTNVLTKWLDHYFPQDKTDDIFLLYRMLMPKEDRSRGTFGLKDAALVKALIKATELGSSHRLCQQAEQWKQTSTKNVRNCAMAMEELLFKSQCEVTEVSGKHRQLTLGQVDQLLQQLVEAKDKSSVLRSLLQVTTHQQMRWIAAIILHDVKVGMSEARIWASLHPDANDLYNVTMDMPRVCRELRDPRVPMKRMDVEPGSSIKPQLATRASTVEDCFRRMAGRPFVVEAKWDGIRIQCHLEPGRVLYVSRRGVEHGEHTDYNVMDAAVRAQVNSPRCILDGEMIVWNKARKYGEPFGGFNSVIRAAVEGAPPETIVCMDSTDSAVYTAREGYCAPAVGEVELVYVVFDVLYTEEEGSVIRRSLQDRQALLQRLIGEAPPGGVMVGGGTVSARLVALLPEAVLLDDAPFSRVGTSVEAVQDMFDRALEKQEEGIVVKALDSQWRINDRSNSWVKLKPDYVSQAEIDAVILGLYYRGTGLLSDLLLGLPEPPRVPCEPPSSWVTFCRVGTGLSEGERDVVRSALNSNVIKKGPDGRRVKPPRCYRTTGTAKETPDAWVVDPLRSVVVQVNADVRTIVSKTFASDYSLRFPRVTRLRMDKGAADATSTAELRDLVASNRGMLTGGLRQGDLHTLSEYHSLRRKRAAERKAVGAAGGRPPRAPVPSHFLPTDVSAVPVVVDVLRGASVALLNHGAYSKRELEALVKQLGGVTHQNAGSNTTYLVAAEPGGYKYDGQVGGDRQDILAVGWLQECLAEGRLLEQMPRHLLHLCAMSRLAEKEDRRIDRHGDPLTEEVSSEDVRCLLERLVLESDVAAARKQREAAQLAQAAGRNPAGPAAAAAAGKEAAEDATQDPRLQVEAALACQDLQHPDSTLFLGTRVMLIRLQGGGAVALEEALQQLSDRPLLDGVQGPMAAACQVQQQLHELRLRALELQVLAHGGTLVSQLPATSGPGGGAAAEGGVTHIVVCPPAELATQHAQQVQQQRLCLEASEAPATADAGSTAALAEQQQAAAGAAKRGPALPADAVVSELVARCPPERLRDVWQLKQSLLAGRVALVTPAWVQDSLRGLEQHKACRALQESQQSQQRESQQQESQQQVQGQSQGQSQDESGVPAAAAGHAAAAAGAAAGVRAGHSFKLKRPRRQHAAVKTQPPALYAPNIVVDRSAAAPAASGPAAAAGSAQQASSTCTSSTDILASLGFALGGGRQKKGQQQAGSGPAVTSPAAGAAPAAEPPSPGPPAAAGAGTSAAAAGVGAGSSPGLAPGSSPLPAELMAVALWPWERYGITASLAVPEAAPGPAAAARKRGRRGEGSEGSESEQPKRRRGRGAAAAGGRGRGATRGKAAADEGYMEEEGGSGEGAAGSQEGSDATGEGEEGSPAAAAAAASLPVSRRRRGLPRLLAGRGPGRGGGAAAAAAAAAQREDGGGSKGRAGRGRRRGAAASSAAEGVEDTAAEDDDDGDEAAGTAAAAGGRRGRGRGAARGRSRAAAAPKGRLKRAASRRASSEEEEVLASSDADVSDAGVSDSDMSGASGAGEDEPASAAPVRRSRRAAARGRLLYREEEDSEGEEEQQGQQKQQGHATEGKSAAVGAATSPAAALAGMLPAAAQQQASGAGAPAASQGAGAPASQQGGVSTLQRLLDRRRARQQAEEALQQAAALQSPPPKPAAAPAVPAASGQPQHAAPGTAGAAKAAGGAEQARPGTVPSAARPPRSPMSAAAAAAAATAAAQLRSHSPAAGQPRSRSPAPLAVPPALAPGGLNINSLLEHMMSDSDDDLPLPPPPQLALPSAPLPAALAVATGASGMPATAATAVPVVPVPAASTATGSAAAAAAPAPAVLPVLVPNWAELMRSDSDSDDMGLPFGGVALPAPPAAPAPAPAQHQQQVQQHQHAAGSAGPAVGPPSAGYAPTIVPGPTAQGPHTNAAAGAALGLQLAAPPATAAVPAALGAVTGVGGLGPGPAGQGSSSGAGAGYGGARPAPMALPALRSPPAIPVAQGSRLAEARAKLAALRKAKAEGADEG